MKLKAKMGKNKPIASSWQANFPPISKNKRL